MLSVPTLETFTRIGFAARGIMYLVIGYLALQFGRSEDAAGALKYLAEGTGKILLAVMALGFVAYGVWRLSDAFLDTEGRGDGMKGKAARIGAAASGIIHLGLAFVAARLAFAEASGGGAGGGPQAQAATALSLPGGTILLTIAGATLIGTGLWQFVNAGRADFLRNLDSRAAHQSWVIWLGRAGYAARGVVFLLAGWFLLQSGLSSDSSEAGGMEEALSSLSASLLAIVAFGLVLFGLFSLVEARHRRINDPKVLARLKGQAHRLT